jgi:hypothetical protein
MSRGDACDDFSTAVRLCLPDRLHACRAEGLSGTSEDLRYCSSHGNRDLLSSVVAHVLEAGRFSARPALPHAAATLGLNTNGCLLGCATTACTHTFCGSTQHFAWHRATRMTSAASGTVGVLPRRQM